MKMLIASCTLAFCAAASAEPTFTDGPFTVRLLDSECSSEVASAALEVLDAKTKPKRADVMLAGEHISGCWAEDEDRDILIADRTASWAAIYRSSFTEIGTGPKGSRGTDI